jgi:hypothetical protein
MFYGQDVGILYQLLLTISTQVLGYAIAGVTRAFLVRPSGMVWPGTLVAKAMFQSLHKNENKPAGDWTISRFKFFLYVFLASAAFYFLPGFLMPALSYFNVITWLAPQSVVIANLVGFFFISVPTMSNMFIVWGQLWPWSLPTHVRLVTDCIHRLTSGCSLLGST